MKSIQIRLQDADNQLYRWTIRRVPRAVNLCLGRKPRVISGWEFEDHDGYVRFSEGNWQDLVSMFLLVADNYGFRTLTNLS